MALVSGPEQKTAYGVFVQACWAQHKRQYPDELIRKEIEEFNQQCSVWWYNLSDEERERFQKMADNSNATQALNNTSHTTQVDYKPIQASEFSSLTEEDFEVNSDGVVTPILSKKVPIHNITPTSAASGVSSFGSPHFDYGIQQGQMHPARTAYGQMQQVGSHQVVHQPFPHRPHQNQKPMKDPNEPKRPMSAYFIFNSEERIKVKAEFPDYPIVEIAKEVGRRWACIDPALKESYELRYQESRRQYEKAMQLYNPSKKKKKDPNAPKQPLSAYFIYQTEVRDKIKSELQNPTICDVAKEVGRRWTNMAPEVKQRYQQMSEVCRQKYDQEMRTYLKNKSMKMSEEDRKVYDQRMVSYSQGAREATPAVAATVTKPEAADGVAFYRVHEVAPATPQVSSPSTSAGATNMFAPTVFKEEE